MESRPIKKYCDYYYQAIKKQNGYGWVIYNAYSKNRQIIEQSEDEDVSDAVSQAEQEAKDAISYHYI